MSSVSPNKTQHGVSHIQEARVKLFLRNYNSPGEEEAQTTPIIFYFFFFKAHIFHSLTTVLVYAVS